ncbi:MAG: response regulator [Lachnospiraceae bacterium]|nr:response regulator [Lachnospiraceae bacterium]
MKKYKILLAGKNNTIIDDFFNHMSDVFYLVTTSVRYEDVIHHLDIYKPDIFVYCLKNESRDDLIRIMEHKRRLTRDGVVTVIVGTQEDCENFQKVAIYMEDLVLAKPISASGIKEKILEYMEDVEKEKEEQKLLQEKLAAVKAKDERKHVLVIDDDPIMLKLIKEHLHEQYDVATAISGKIAHKFLETKKTNLILLDYEMPGENGPEVMKKIRENDALSDIPIIFLTGITEKEKIRQALVLKPQGYLLKPIDKDKLLGTIEKFV